jgi:hypothetical protein
MGTPCTNCIDATTFGQSKECFTIGTDSIIYTGPPLPCSTIQTHDTFTEALQKLDAMICILGAPQNLQNVLITGNIATDIGAKFVSSITPLIYTQILHDQVIAGKFVKIGGLPTEFLMADGTVSTIDDFITQSITDGDTEHAPSSDAVYDALTTIVANVLFDADIPVVLSGGKSLGKYTTGQSIPAIGKTAQQVITDIALEYIYPAFTFFSVTGQATTIETGTTLSGVKPFVWSINPYSGIVPTIDLYDNTASAFLLSGTPNDGAQSQTITTIQLNADGATQSWKGIANNTSPVSAINSGNFVVTARYVRWWAPVAAYPVNPLDGAGNRAYALALPNSAFKTPGSNTFLLQTGTVQNRFIVLLPPGVTISSVIDLTNANTNITPSFILSPITINDAGGTPRNYNMYQYTNAIPYTTSANLSITTT